METKKSKVNFSNQVIEQINAEQLDQILENGNFTIIDVRSPQGIESQGSIPGAINIPLDDVKQQIDMRTIKPESILNGEGPFLFVCTGGVMSYIAAIHAQENGMKQIFNLEGGHSAWLKIKKEEKENQLA